MTFIAITKIVSGIHRSTWSTQTPLLLYAEILRILRLITSVVRSNDFSYFDQKLSGERFLINMGSNTSGNCVTVQKFEGSIL